MRSLIWFLAGAVALAAFSCAGGLVFLTTQAHGFSARETPSVVECWLAQQARTMVLPAGAKDRANPVPDSPAVLAKARAHWADHRGHSNNGGGDADMGKHMYPPAVAA